MYLLAFAIWLTHKSRICDSRICQTPGASEYDIQKLQQLHEQLGGSAETAADHFACICKLWIAAVNYFTVSTKKFSLQQNFPGTIFEHTTGKSNTTFTDLLYVQTTKSSNSYFGSKLDIHWNHFLQCLKNSNAQFFMLLAGLHHVFCV